jgi:hypothetical protein
MIEDVKARDLAIAKLRELLGEEAARTAVLEEIELTAEGAQWLVTLGYREPWSAEERAAVRNPELAEILGTYRRRFKVFRLDARTGQFRGMTERAASLAG